MFGKTAYHLLILGLFFFMIAAQPSYAQEKKQEKLETVKKGGKVKAKKGKKIKGEKQGVDQGKVSKKINRTWPWFVWKKKKKNPYKQKNNEDLSGSGNNGPVGHPLPPVNPGQSGTGKIGVSPQPMSPVLPSSTLRKKKKQKERSPLSAPATHVSPTPIQAGRSDKKLFNRKKSSPKKDLSVKDTYVQQKGAIRSQPSVEKTYVPVREAYKGQNDVKNLYRPMRQPNPNQSVEHLYVPMKKPSAPDLSVKHLYVPMRQPNPNLSVEHLYVPMKKPGNTDLSVKQLYVPMKKAGNTNLSVEHLYVPMKKPENTDLSVKNLYVPMKKPGNTNLSVEHLYVPLKKPQHTDLSVKNLYVPMQKPRNTDLSVRHLWIPVHKNYNTDYSVKNLYVPIRKPQHTDLSVPNLYWVTKPHYNKDLSVKNLYVKIQDHKTNDLDDKKLYTATVSKPEKMPLHSKKLETVALKDRKDYLHYDFDKLETATPFAERKKDMQNTAEDIADYQGDMKVKRSKDADMHPSSRHLAAENDRPFFADLEQKWSLFWSRLWHGNDQQPDAVKDKVRKPRYDKGERSIWQDTTVRPKAAESDN